MLLWDLETGKCRRSLTGHKGHITAVEWFADAGEAGDGSQLVLSGAQDGHLRVWDLRSQSCVANVPAHTSDSGSGAVGSIACTAMSASALGGLAGDMVVTIGADKAVVVSDPRRNFEPLRRWTEHREFPYVCVGCGFGICCTTHVLRAGTPSRLRGRWCSLVMAPACCLHTTLILASFSTASAPTKARCVAWEQLVTSWWLRATTAMAWCSRFGRHVHSQ